MPRGPKGLIRHRRHDRTVTLCTFDRLDSRNADDMSVKMGSGLRESSLRRHSGKRATGPRRCVFLPGWAEAGPKTHQHCRNGPARRDLCSHCLAFDALQHECHAQRDRDCRVPTTIVGPALLFGLAGLGPSSFPDLMLVTFQDLKRADECFE